MSSVVDPVIELNKELDEIIRMKEEQEPSLEVKEEPDEEEEVVDPVIELNKKLDEIIRMKEEQEPSMEIKEEPEEEEEDVPKEPEKNWLEPQDIYDKIIFTCGKARDGKPCIILALDPKKSKEGDAYNVLDANFHVEYKGLPCLALYRTHYWLSLEQTLEYGKTIIVQNSIVENWYQQSQHLEDFHVIFQPRRDYNIAATARFPIDMEIHKQYKEKMFKRAVVLSMAVFILALWLVPPGGNSTPHVYRINSTDTLDVIYSHNDQFRAYDDYLGRLKIQQNTERGLSIFKNKKWKQVWSMPLHDTATEDNRKDLSVYMGIDRQGRLTARNSGNTFHETWSSAACDKLASSTSCKLCKCNYLELTNDGKLNVYDGLDRVVVTINE